MPLHGLTLAALSALYLLAGLIGHDPWKNDDAIHFGVAYGFLDGGSWLVPHLAGEPFLETPPLYYWVAAICARLFGWLLPAHDAARLASGLFGALFLGLLAYASNLAHRLEDVERKPADASGKAEGGNAAILIAIGSLGLLVPIHDTQPLVALLAASAATYAGLSLLPRRPLAGGLMGGLGLGLGFLSNGLIAVITLAPLLLLLPLNVHWRQASSLGGLAIAIAVAVPLCVSWPLLLAWQAPDMLDAWWSFAVAGLHRQSNWLKALSDLAELLAWFTWPALPLALWAVWLNRRRLGQPAIVLPLLGTLTTLLALLLLYEPRPLQALPLLVPLTLLAATGASRLRRGASNAFDWFGMMTFAIIAGLIWLGGIAMICGVPAQIARNFAKLQPGYVAHFSPLSYGFAVLLTLTWCWLVIAGPRSPWRAATNWAAGMTLIWTLLMTLWLSWIDYGKSYRDVAASLKLELADKTRYATSSEVHQYPNTKGGYPYPETKSRPKSRPPCIAGLHLGNAQRVSLQYFANIVTRRTTSAASTNCPLLLVQGSPRNVAVPPGWRKVWEGHRPGDRSEILRLYSLMK